MPRQLGHMLRQPPEPPPVRTMLLAAALAAVPVSAVLADGSRRPSTATYLESAEGRVPVWRDRDALREGWKLIEAGVHRSRPEFVLRLLSCVVPNGTQAVVTDGGMLTSLVLVVDGPRAGCRGAVDTDRVQRAAAR